MHNYSVERVDRDNDFFEEFQIYGEELRDKAVQRRSSETNSARNKKTKHQQEAFGINVIKDTYSEDNQESPGKK